MHSFVRCMALASWGHGARTRNAIRPSCRHAGDLLALNDMINEVFPVYAAKVGNRSQDAPIGRGDAANTSAPQRAPDTGQWSAPNAAHAQQVPVANYATQPVTLAGVPADTVVVPSVPAVGQSRPRQPSSDAPLISFDDTATTSAAQAAPPQGTVPAAAFISAPSSVATNTAGMPWLFDYSRPPADVYAQNSDVPTHASLHRALSEKITAQVRPPVDSAVAVAGVRGCTMHASKASAAPCPVALLTPRHPCP